MEILALKEWYTVLGDLEEHKGIAILLGVTDTGKSTLSKFLITHLCQMGLKVALVDADIGQSFLGPPTTIGLALFESPPGHRKGKNDPARLSQEVKFLAPVRIGDTITARVEVIELIPDKNRVKFKTTCTNQDGKEVVDGIAWTMPPKKE